MSVDQISAEESAKLFNQSRRMLAPIFECDETAYTAEWDAAQPRERKLQTFPPRKQQGRRLTIPQKTRSPSSFETAEAPSFSPATKSAAYSPPSQSPLHPWPANTPVKTPPAAVRVRL